MAVFVLIRAFFCSFRAQLLWPEWHPSGRFATTRSASAFRLIDEAIEFWYRPEIEKYTDFERGRVQVVQQLRRGEFWYRVTDFRLDDDSLVDDEVETVPRHMSSLVADLDCELPANFMAAVA